MRAQVPEDQDQRLAELRSYAILDTEQEKSFDEIVHLVRRLLDVPVVLISLVDQDRQWFKSKVGTDETETPLDQSICSHAILGDTIFEIPDTRKDPRTRDSAMTTGPLVQIRFYAGAPLITPSGRKMGTLCVLDTDPRQLTEEERSTLRIMANQVMNQLELRRTLANEIALRDEMDHRVKNSMQSVASFLRLYRANAKTEESRDILDAVLRRVMAVSDLHQALYQSENRHSIDLSDFLKNSVGLLQEQAPDGVTLEAEIEQISVPAQTANALALILSEFTANSFKHAFPDGATGSVRIRVLAHNGRLQMTCADSGVLTGIQSAPSTGIGMRIMEAAAQQIDAQLTIGRRQDGYALDLIVPLVSKLPKSMLPERQLAVEPEL